MQPMQTLQPGLTSQGAAGSKAGLPSTWSDTPVNISLDFLGMQAPKASQPTLNTLQQGKKSSSDPKGYILNLVYLFI
jgi:hypothetical protein